MDFFVYGFWAAFILFVAFKFITSIRIVPTREVLIVERFGKYNATLEAGFHLLIPFIDRVSYKHTLKEQAIEVQPQICITRDNVQVKVDGILYLVVLDPQKASYGIDDYVYAAVQLAQTTMRAIIGTMDLDKTFEARANMNQKIVDILDQASESWGVRVNRYEIQNLTPPKTVIESMEKQKNSELKKRAEISLSEGDRNSRINRSQGLMQEAINKSEGEKQKWINESEGKAKEILAIAEATAKSIRKIAESISMKGGKDAVRLQVSERYISQLKKLAKENSDVIVPLDITSMESVTASIENFLNKTDR